MSSDIIDRFVGHFVRLQTTGGDHTGLLNKDGKQYLINGKKFFDYQIIGVIRLDKAG